MTIYNRPLASIILIGSVFSLYILARAKAKIANMSASMLLRLIGRSSKSAVLKI